MDAALIAVVAAKAKLTKTQFTKIEANVSIFTPMRTGQLTVATEVGLNRNKSGTPDALSTVTIEVIGVSTDSKKDASPAFNIKVTIRGVYSWDTIPSGTQFESDYLSSLLAKPLHVLAVSEVHSIARQLGLQGVQLQWDVPDPSVEKPRKKLASLKKENITTVAPKVKRASKKPGAAS